MIDISYYFFLHSPMEKRLRNVDAYLALQYGTVGFLNLRVVSYKWKFPSKGIMGFPE